MLLFTERCSALLIVAIDCIVVRVKMQI